ADVDPAVEIDDKIVDVGVRNLDGYSCGKRRCGGLQQVGSGENVPQCEDPGGWIVVLLLRKKDAVGSGQCPERDRNRSGCNVSFRIHRAWIDDLASYRKELLPGHSKVQKCLTAGSNIDCRRARDVRRAPII